MYLGISEDVSRAKTNNSLKFRRAAPRLSAQMYLVLSKSGSKRIRKNFLYTSNSRRSLNSGIQRDIPFTFA